MRIGLDFDNTIVCYDEAIKLLAEKIQDLPPAMVVSKLGLRDFLRSEGREEEWTRFQGELYGPGMLHAKPYEGAINAIKELKANGHQVFIVSHRSRFPYAGRRYDLHFYARKWIAANLAPHNLFRDLDGSRDCSDSSYFLESKHEKLTMIKELDCNVFVDDLVDVLKHSDFPDKTLSILFDPSHENCEDKGIDITAHSWKDISLSILDRDAE